MTTTREVLEMISELGHDVNRDEVRDILERLGDDDFYAEIDGAEYRFIDADYIWDIYVEAIKEITEDCYNIDAPHWLAIDWEETAQNCYVDGYGHTFSHYDGSEEEFELMGTDYYVFRVN